LWIQIKTSNNVSPKICYENIVNVAVFIIYRPRASIRIPPLPFLSSFTLSPKFILFIEN